jgi:hypothetical protein
MIFVMVNELGGLVSRRGLAAILSVEQSDAQKKTVGSRVLPNRPYI